MSYHPDPETDSVDTCLAYVCASLLGVLLGVLLVTLLCTGCASRQPTCAEMRRDPQRYCPDLTNDTGPCDPRTPLQRACCCGDGRPPCEVR